MKTISRNSFLRQCVGAGVGSFLLTHRSALGCARVAEDEFYHKIVQANNVEVASLLRTLATDITEVKRRYGFDLANLAAAYCEPTSQYFERADLPAYMVKIIHFLSQAQHADGTLDIGNLASPPDTAFLLEPLCTAATILRTNTTDALNEVKNLLKAFIIKAGAALKVGGVHTPNHRWVVSGALAKINALYPDPGYIKRIQEWLAEGVFVDEDGNYLERSMTYSAVIDRSLITMARLLNAPRLLQPVRKNLQLVYYHMEPNGDLVTTDSRRQDQYLPSNVLNFYQSFQYLAIHDANAEFAAIVRFIETLPGFDDRLVRDLLATYLEEPLYKQPLRTPKASPAVFEKFFKHTNLVRIRRNTTTTTLFGGADFPIIIASGRSTNPTMFSYRKGAAVLKYLRLSTDFFSTGYFRSQGIVHKDGKYILHQKIDVPYYQPLPAQYRKANGNYQLSLSKDGRFWNKMDFEHRPQSNQKTLAVTVIVAEKDGATALTFQVKGETGVRVTIELCFQEGGEFTGLTKVVGATDSFALETRIGEYRYGTDSIKFGPGLFKHNKLNGLEGEVYATHFGTLRTEGMYAYLTGITPFEHTLTIS